MLTGNPNLIEFATAMTERQNKWVPACGGSETPFKTKTRHTLLYCYNPALRQHAYVNVETDMVLTNEEARTMLP